MAKQDRKEKLQNLTDTVCRFPEQVWKSDSPIREATELLHGALWHLSCAITFGEELDPTPVKERLKHPSLWKEWIDKGMPECKPIPLVQDMMVSDACLRLAGALDRFPHERSKIRELIKQGEELIKQGKGDCVNSPMIRVIVHRDSFMHIETPSENDEEMRRSIRRYMMKSSDTTSVAQLFDDCLSVGIELAEAIVKDNSNEP